MRAASVNSIDINVRHWKHTAPDCNFPTLVWLTSESAKRKNLGASSRTARGAESSWDISIFPKSETSPKDIQRWSSRLNKIGSVGCVWQDVTRPCLHAVLHKAKGGSPKTTADLASFYTWRKIKNPSVFKDTHETKAHRNLGGTLQKPEEIIAHRIKLFFCCELEFQHYVLWKHMISNIDFPWPGTIPQDMQHLYVYVCGLCMVYIWPAMFIAYVCLCMILWFYICGLVVMSSSGAVRYQSFALHAMCCLCTACCMKGHVHWSPLNVWDVYSILQGLLYIYSFLFFSSLSLFSF